MKIKRLSSENTLFFKQSASCFNDALLLGNGRMGAIVYGGASEEKISLNEDTLWSGSPVIPSEENYPPILGKVRELFFEGKKEEAQRLIESKFGYKLNQVYLPLADIKINQYFNGEAKRYQRKLSLADAIHTVSYSADDCSFKRECFVSAPYQVLAISFTASKTKKISFDLALEVRLKCEYENDKNCIALKGKAPTLIADYGDAYRNESYIHYEENGVSYIGLVTVKAVGGSVEYNGNTVSVSGADSAVAYFATRTNFIRFDKMPSGEEYIEKCFADIKNASAVEYALLKKESVAAHRKLYNCSAVSLLDNSKARIPTDERLKLVQKGEQDNALCILLLNLGKYLTIAGSREGSQATNLQGIWNDIIIPPWSSNFTININTEMNYWPTLKLGLKECYEPFIRFVTELSESGSLTAKNFYGKSGWVTHHNSDLWRLSHPATGRLNNSAQWGFWNASSGWLAKMLWDYYRYTLDKKYLKKVYPIIEGAARFYKESLVECEGRLIYPLSTSPENNYIENGEMMPIDKSTSMTQEIIYDLFDAVGRAQETLGLENTYSEILPKLKKPGFCKNGELCEWHEEHEVWDPHHRHVSHLYGLFPANLFDDKERQAAKKVLESRGDGGTGWSLAWKINFWARLGDGEHALKLLKNQLRVVPAVSNSINMDSGGGSYPNLLCAHPPFQIDGNFGAASGIIEMLVQSDNDGNAKLLPALPKEWKNGFVENICLPGNKKISFAWENGKIIKMSIKEK